MTRSSHTSPTITPDFTMANLIPVSYFAAGSLCWEGDDGTVYWRLSWGGSAYTGSNLGDTANDPDGDFGPAFEGNIATTCASALQFSGNATDFSANNADDYSFKGNEIFFFNNATAGCTVADGYHHRSGPERVGGSRDRLRQIPHHPRRVQRQRNVRLLRDRWHRNQSQGLPRTYRCRDYSLRRLLHRDSGPPRQ